jgi:hypothetical protein
LIVAVKFNQHCEVDVRTKGCFDSLQVRSVPVARQLHTMREPRREIVPAMISAAAPIVPGDAIVFLFANYRGDVWIRDIG